MLRYVLCASMCFFAGLAGQIEQSQAEPVEYVRICDAYGAGFFYIPGTETCLRLEAGADVGLTRTSVALGNVFDRTAGATDTSDFTQSDTEGRVGADVRVSTPLGDMGHNRIFAGAWAAPTLGGGQEFTNSVTYAVGDSIRNFMRFTPNLFTAYGGFERDVATVGDGDLSAGFYAGARLVRIEMSLSGQAVTDFDVSRNATRAVPLAGFELTYRPNDKKCMCYGFFGRAGIQYQGGIKETLSASTAGADVTTTFEVKHATHFYFQIGRAFP